MNEELYCLKFELNALSEVTLKNESERWIPGFIHTITEKDHVDRYKLACHHSKGKKVLDIACGVGKGSYMIGIEGEASFVMGCDLSPSAIRYAKHRNCHPQISFQVQNAEQFLNENEFDLVVSFESIEHLKDPARFLENVKKNLRTGGQLIISTPIASESLNISPSNPYHMQEWGFTEFQDLIKTYFQIETIFTQLYQNSFINVKLQEEFDLNELSEKSVLKNFIIHKVLRRPSKARVNPPYLNDGNACSNFSKIEEFNGQYEIETLGKIHVGYQILVCKNLNE